MPSSTGSSNADIGLHAADTADLAAFVEAGERLVVALDRLAATTEGARRRVDALLGRPGPLSAGPAVEAHRHRVEATNRFVRSVDDSLASRDAPGDPAVAAPAPTVALVGRPSVVGRPSAALFDHVAGGEALRAGWESVDDGLGWVRRTIGSTVERLVDPVDDLVVDTVPVAAAVPELAGWASFGPVYPLVASAVNRVLTPTQVMQLWAQLDRLVVDGPRTGDPGGTFTTRPTGERLAGPPARPAEAGRRAVTSALADTADGDAILHDEFQLIRHDAATYTVVLPGVVDLRDPGRGLDDRHRSVRDVDAVAARSAASAAVEDNLYAQMVVEALDRVGVAHGARLMLVGHSLGADTAIDLAADARFNGDRYTVTHVVAAGYHSEPQLDQLEGDTSVLVLQNNKDVVVMVESIAHLSLDPFEEFTDPGSVIVREFDGGWKGAGHHQDNYIDYVEDLSAGGDDPELARYFASVAAGGFGRPGRAVAVDISWPAESAGGRS